MGVGEMVGVGFVIVAVLLLVREWLTDAEVDPRHADGPDATSGRATR